MSTRPVRNREAKLARATNGATAAPKPDVRGLFVKRISQMRGLVARAIEIERSDIVHDLRVVTRRLDQTLRFAVGGESRGVRRLRRTLRKIRRALGGWRNQDVLLERIRPLLAETDTAPRARGWAFVYAAVAADRAVEVAAARKALRKVDLDRFLDEARSIVPATKPVTAESYDERARQTWGDWIGALECADATRDPEAIHALRIAGKRLRYQLELADAPDPSTAKVLRAFRRLQNRLGDWNDRRILRAVAAEVVRRSRLFESDQPAAEAVLADLRTDAMATQADLSAAFGAARAIVSARAGTPQ